MYHGLSNRTVSKRGPQHASRTSHEPTIPQVRPRSSQNLSLRRTRRNLDYNINDVLFSITSPPMCVPRSNRTQYGLRPPFLVYHNCRHHHQGSINTEPPCLYNSNYQRDTSALSACEHCPAGLLIPSNCHPIYKRNTPNSRNGHLARRLAYPPQL